MVDNSTSQSTDPIAEKEEKLTKREADIARSLANEGVDRLSYTSINGVGQDYFQSTHKGLQDLVEVFEDPATSAWSDSLYKSEPEGINVMNPMLASQAEKIQNISYDDLQKISEEKQYSVVSSSPQPGQQVAFDLLRSQMGLNISPSEERLIEKALSENPHQLKAEARLAALDIQARARDLSVILSEDVTRDELLQLVKRSGIDPINGHSIVGILNEEWSLRSKEEIQKSLAIMRLNSLSEKQCELLEETYNSQYSSNASNLREQLSAVDQDPDTCGLVDHLKGFENRVDSMRQFLEDSANKLTISRSGMSGGLAALGGAAGASLDARRFLGKSFGSGAISKVKNTASAVGSIGISALAGAALGAESGRVSQRSLFDGTYMAVERTHLGLTPELAKSLYYSRDERGNWTDLHAESNSISDYIDQRYQTETLIDAYVENADRLENSTVSEQELEQRASALQEALSLNVRNGESGSLEVIPLSTLPLQEQTDFISRADRVIHSSFNGLSATQSAKLVSLVESLQRAQVLDAETGALKIEGAATTFDGMLTSTLGLTESVAQSESSKLEQGFEAKRSAHEMINALRSIDGFDTSEQMDENGHDLAQEFIEYYTKNLTKAQAKELFTQYNELIHEERESVQLRILDNYPAEEEIKILGLMDGSYLYTWENKNQLGSIHKFAAQRTTRQLMAAYSDHVSLSSVKPLSGGFSQDVAPQDPFREAHSLFFQFFDAQGQETFSHTVRAMRLRESLRNKSSAEIVSAVQVAKSMYGNIFNQEIEKILGQQEFQRLIRLKKSDENPWR